MHPSIKQYKLKPNTTRENLLNAGFKDGGWQMQFCNPKVSYTTTLIDSIELHIEIITYPPIDFDCINNVLILDEDFCQPYSPFYGDIEFEYLNKVIHRYNEVMDRFVKKGIFEYV